jgi:hypothetical protein
MITIDTKEISSIHVIGESKNKVLIVKLLNSNRPLVVKSEETATDNMGDLVSRNNVGAMLEFHGTLFSKLRALPFDTERLKLTEITALRACNPNKVTGLNDNETWPNLFDTDIAKQSGRIKAVVKLSYVEQLANLNGMTKDLQQIGLIRAALEAGDANFVFELGEIFAVDFFIGNHDRFTPTGMLRGPQNVFFSTKGGVVKATGIDTYDIFGEWSDLNKTIEAIEASGAGKWPGRMLAPGNVKSRDALAQQAVEQILVWAYEGGGGFKAEGKPIAERRISDSRRSSLVKLFHKGMSEAKSTLRKKYQLGDNLAALQAGIRSRWNIIRG